MADAQCEDEAIERNLAPCVDCLEQFSHADTAEALDVLKLGERLLLPRLERENIRRRANHQRRILALEEEIDLLGAEPLDVEGIARDEMLDVLDRLGAADEAAGAAGDGIQLAGFLVFLPHRMAAADRAFRREDIFCRILWPLLQHNIEDLRNDIAGALDDNRVTDPDIMLLLADTLTGIADALDIVGIVQGGIGHDHAADRHRRQTGDGCQRAGAPNLNVDGLDRGKGLLCRKLVGRCPARRTRSEAEARLQIQPVDLVDHAIDIVIQIGALEPDIAVVPDDLLDRAQPARQWIDRKAPALEDLHHAPLGIFRHLAHLAPGIGEETQVAARRHLWIELAQRTRSGVARVDIGLFALGLHLRIERHEIGFRHIDLAAHFHDIGRIGRQFLRDFADRADIGRDVFTGRPVPTRGGRHQPAVLVAQRHGQTVDLRLGGKRDGLVRHLPEEAIDGRHEILHVLVGKRVVER